ncbi:hypothetical protein RB195_008854 [Necator americanus]|uniref:Reverse transcriptase domain-containing protein n=1 Tax=Necator americanus TaxID=51031 RepID=A0ABR1CQN9_NECAM
MTVGGPTITLSNGVKMPQVGLGTWQSSPAEVKGAVKAAIEAGYRLIDTAACYQNEGAIGEVIHELIQAGKVKREELFITTKLWVTHLHPDDIESAIRESLRLLQVDYVDLYIPHMPTCFNHNMTAQNHSVKVEDVWKGLEAIYKKGLTKAIGLSNFSGEQVERIMKIAEIPIHNLQVADRGLTADQKRPCACPETQVDSGDGLPASAVPGLTRKIIVSRTSVRPKACNQLTGRCKGGGLESPPTNKLHMSTLGERKFSQKPMGLEACNLPVGFKFHAKNSNRKESPDSGRKPGTVAPGRTGLQESCRLPKRKRTRMTICTYNARTLASEAAIKDLMVQAKKIKYDVIGLTETRRRHSLNAVFETGEELFLGTCDSRGVGGVGVLVNTSMAQNIDSFEQLTTRIGRLRMRRCGPTPALTIFVAYAPTSSYEEEEVEAFYMDLEKFYREDHAFYKVIIGDFNAKVGPRRTPEELHIGTHGLQWNDQGERLSEFIMTTKTIHGNSQFQKPFSLRWTWESPGGGYRNEIDHIIVNKRFCLTDVAVVPKFYTGSDHRLLRGRFSFTRRAEKAAKFSKRNPRTTINWDLFATLAGFWEDSAMDNIDEEYDRLVKHLHDCAKKAESIKTTKRRLSLETLELIRQRGAARAAGNQELTSELARLCREAIKKDLKERRAEVLAEAAEAGKSIRYARRDFASRKTRMTALRNPKGTTIASRRGMEKIIYDFYSDLFDSRAHLPPHHLREDGHVIPAVLPSEIRHAIMSVRNRTAAGPDRIKPEHLKNLPPVLINTLARIFTRYLSECKVPKQWKTSKTVLLYKKGDPHDIGNYRPICLLSVIYKLFTRVILNRIEKVLDEGQPCEQAGFRKGFSTIDHIHTVSRLIEVSREYKMPLCLTFIDLKKAFDSVETEAVVEALDNQGVPTQYIKVLRELYSNFTTGISPFYKNIIIDVKRGVRQGDTISPKIFTATLENAMRKLEWDDMGVKIDGRQLHHLRFADDIVLITPSISQAERMLTEFAETCGCIGLELNLQKTMFMRNGWISDAPFTLNGTNISECTSYVYLGRELNMMNDLAPELGRRRRAAWGAYKSIEDVVKKTKNTRLRAHLFNTTVLPALTYASETWALRKQEENAVSVIERAIERVMLGVSRFKQVRDGIRSSLLRQRSKIRDAAAFAKESKIRWAGHVMRFNDNRWTRAVSEWIPRDIKRNTGRPPTRWSDFFTKSFKENYDALRVPRERRNHWATLARDRDKWKNYWRPLDRFEDQRESRQQYHEIEDDMESVRQYRVELHLYWPQHELHEICKKHNISITSYATLGSPGRVNFKLPSGVKLEWAPAPADMDDPNVKKLAEKYKKTPAQILLRYVMDRNIAVIPKSVNPSRIVENFQVFDFKLTPDEIKELETTPHRQRLFLQDFMEGHPEDAFASERKH